MSRSGAVTARQKPRVPITIGNATFAGGGAAFGDRTLVSATGTSRTVHTAAWDGTNIRVGYGNWAVLAQGVESAGTSTYTITSGLLYSGTIYPLTFDGRSSVTVDPNGYINSDPLGLDIPGGATFEILTYLTSSSADWQPNHASLNATGTGGFIASVNYAIPGSPAVANSVSYLYGPYEITATPRKTWGLRSWLHIGDSIAAGQGESAGVNKGPRGPLCGVNRAFNGKAGVITVAREGEQFAHWVTTVGRLRRLSLVEGVTDVTCNLGRNDVTSAATLATIQANAISLWRDCNYRGARVHQTTITPRTTSTDAWATVLNQSLVSPAEELVRVAFNEWLRAGAPMINFTAVSSGENALRVGQGNHPLTTVIDATAAVESSLNSGLWSAGFTADGLHPNPSGYSALYATYPIDTLMSQTI